MIELRPVEGIGEITAGDDLAGILWHALGDLRPGDVLVVTSKVVSKALGLHADPDADRGELVLAESTAVGPERAPPLHPDRRRRSGPVMAGAASTPGTPDDSGSCCPRDPDETPGSCTPGSPLSPATNGSA